jgi:hypothetical protein
VERERYTRQEMSRWWEKEEPRGPPRRGEWMTHGSRGKAEERIKRQEEGPHWLNTGQLRGAGLHERR